MDPTTAREIRCDGREEVKVANDRSKSRGVALVSFFASVSHNDSLSFLILHECNPDE